MADENNETAGDGGEKVIPYQRFQTVVSERNDLRKKLAELEGQLQQTTERAATSDTLAKQLKQVESTLLAERADRETERAVWGAGIADPEGIDLVRYLHGKLPEKDRPSVGDWLKTMREKPDAAPKALRPFLGEQQAETKAATEPAETKAAAGAARSGGRVAGSTTTAATGEPASAEQIRQARMHGQNTGDWSAFKRLTGQDKKPPE